MAPASMSSTCPASWPSWSTWAFIALASRARDPLVAGAYEPWDALAKDGKGAALRAVSVDLRMAEDVEGADLVHSHTWYANFGGYMSQILYDLPHVMTCHSLEPLRPWKAEQLGSGYRLSSWVERAAIEHADSRDRGVRAMRDDVLRVYPAVDAGKVKVVYNGIDPDEFFPDPRTDEPRTSGHRRRGPHGPLRREGHPPKGDHLPPRGGQVLRPGRSGRVLCRRP